MKVSPYGFGDGNCQAASWNGGSRVTTVHVDCFGPGGHLENRAFLLVYARSHNILGLSGLTTASARASQPKAKTYAPSPQCDSHPGAKVRVDRLSRGQYRVHFKGSAGRGPGRRRRRAGHHVRQHLRPVHSVQLLPGSNPTALITCYDALGEAVEGRLEGAAVLLDERVELGAFVVQRHIERTHQRLLTSQAGGH